MKRFNIIDFFIVAALVVVAIVGITILNRGPIDFSPDTVKLRLLTEIAANDLFVLDKIKPGPVFLSVDNVYTGTITDVDLEVTQIRTFDKHLEAYKMVDSISGKYNAYITIEVDAVETDRNFSIGDINLKVGSPLFIKAKEYNSKAHILEMEVIE
ncbi:DUF4330 family protein [Candidatus Epulonipiscium viviparus]|uniref:DUF4330 family protein n=1 Tax=Candidatus Epulonipiscium viviparus TaxID=420336 RepID=UPI00016C0041|nr:DUF4330 family protein [Candidatus Epulopiscium viviparus]